MIQASEFADLRLIQVPGLSPELAEIQHDSFVAEDRVTVSLCFNRSAIQKYI